MTFSQVGSLNKSTQLQKNDVLHVKRFLIYFLTPR